jgi:hypothetical protein
VDGETTLLGAMTEIKETLYITNTTHDGKNVRDFWVSCVYKTKDGLSKASMKTDWSLFRLNDVLGRLEPIKYKITCKLGSVNIQFDEI